VQVSRRTRTAFAAQTAAQKVDKVVQWVMEQ
jgi:ribosomal protein S11